MRPLLLFFAAFALSLSAKAQQSAYVMVDTVRLNAAYEALMKKEDADSQREYFDAIYRNFSIHPQQCPANFVFHIAQIRECFQQQANGHISR